METFLHGLLTQSVAGLGDGERRYGALLTPQGKILADMLFERRADAILIDCPAAVVADLTARLMRFRLRARVEIAPCPDLAVAAFAGSPDPRSATAPLRLIAERAGLPPLDINAGPAAYHAARIAAALPEMGADFGPGDVFPADINMDLHNGIDFRKGCFVGQEVVSRMKRRGAARRRTVCVELEREVEGGSPVLCGTDEIGRLTSTAGGKGLARLRIDHLASGLAAGRLLTAAGVALRPLIPEALAREMDPGTADEPQD